MKSRTLIILVIGLIIGPPCFAEEIKPPYGSSKFITFDGISKIDQLKVVFDFNFADPAGVKRALYPVSFTIKTV